MEGGVVRQPTKNLMKWMKPFSRKKKTYFSKFHCTISGPCPGQPVDLVGDIG